MKTVNELQKEYDQANLCLAEQLDFCARASNYAFTHGDSYNGKHYANRAQNLRRVLADHAILEPSSL